MCGGHGLGSGVWRLPRESSHEVIVTDDKTQTEATDRSPFRARTYWLLNSIEMFERLAFFGIRAVVPIYIMQATEPGGLHLTAIHKGWIYMWWAILQSWLPLFTGGIADRYGYKRVLAGSIMANAVGYLMMAYLHSYYGFFAGILVLATGTAFFKPALQGSLAQNLSKKYSSLGWGIFYWVVNIGAFLAPFVATALLGKPHTAEGWRNLFLVCAGFTCCNLLLLFTFRDVQSGADKTQSLAKVFATTVENIWPYWYRGGTLHPVRGPLGIALAIGGIAVAIVAPGNFGLLGLVGFMGGCLLATYLEGGEFVWQPRLLIFLLIMSCFWLMMYQLWDLQPNFITDWVDSSAVADRLPGFAPDGWREYGDRGLEQVPQQILLALNAGLIILLVVPVSWAARKMRTLSAMLVGMSVATIGVLVAGLTGNGWFLLLGIVFFSLGEMWTGPKKNEYLGLIAPPGKKGLYLGYVNVPVGIGVAVGSMIAGVVYDNYGEKATLALKELASKPALIARAARETDWSDSLDKLPKLLGIERDQAFERAREILGGDAGQAADKLRAIFSDDSGQIANLGYIYLAMHPDYQGKVRSKLAEDGAQVTPDELAKRVGKLRKWLGVHSTELWDELRAKMETDPDGAKPDGNRAIIALLWERYGAEDEVLDNLALEYLAQGTPLLQEKIAAMKLENPFRDLQDRIGIGRTKSFAALSAARGADDAAVEAALAEVHTATGVPEDRYYVYLAGRDHLRFFAVARRKWSKDVPTVEAMLSVPELVDLLGPSPDWSRVADNRPLLRKAFARKDWSKTPAQAEYLLGLNPFEARSLVGVEVADSALTTTKYLWDRYKPQYKVWIPFALIGFLATIALGIFGQKAKKWKDMNA